MRTPEILSGWLVAWAAVQFGALKGQVESSNGHFHTWMWSSGKALQLEIVVWESHANGEHNTPNSGGDFLNKASKKVEEG